MKKNLGVKIVASFALLGIILSIVGVALLFIFENSNTQTQQEFTPEQIEELQKLINSQSGNLNISTGSINIEKDSAPTEETNQETN